jgi:hypothetical protein
MIPLDQGFGDRMPVIWEAPHRGPEHAFGAVDGTGVSEMVDDGPGSGSVLPTNPVRPATADRDLASARHEPEEHP